LRLLATLLLVLTAGAHATSLAELPLRDQLGGEDSVAAHRGEVVLVLLITAERLRHLKLWEERLRERYPDLRYLRIADIPGEPPLTEAQVAEKLAERVPKDVAVLIDMDRRWATELSLDVRYPNVLLFDRESQLKAKFLGPVSDNFLGIVGARLDEILAQP
jgi:hypothetical protein